MSDEPASKPALTNLAIAPPISPFKYKLNQDKSDIILNITGAIVLLRVV